MNIRSLATRPGIILQAGALLLAISLEINGQIHFPGPSENPYWIECHFWKPDPYYYVEDIAIYYKSDTTINAITYNTLYHSGTWEYQAIGPYPNGPSGKINDELYAIIRQDTAENKVYLYSNSSEFLLYDFKTLETVTPYPKTFNNQGYDSLFVISQDSIMLNNTVHRKWNLVKMYNGIWHDSAFVSIIEGIGSTFGLIGEFGFKHENGDLLKCFYSDNTGIYPASLTICDRTFGIEDHIKKKEINVYPNPSDRAISIVVGSDVHRMEVMLSDLSGRTLMLKSLNAETTCMDLSLLDAGVYMLIFICEGRRIETRKLVVRGQ